MEIIPQSTAKLVVFRAYLASNGSTPATGKTIAITISKNGATSFSNPAAGATNATEMASGFYKFTLGTDDTDTAGPLAWRGAEGTIHDAGNVMTVGVVPANTTQIGGQDVGLSSDNRLRVDVAEWNDVPLSTTNNLDAAISTRASQTSVDDVPTNSELATALAAADDAVLTAIGGLNDISASDVNAQVLDVLDVDTLVAGKTIAEALAIIGGSAGGVVSGAGTGTEVFKDFAGNTVMTVTVDTDGNRTVVVYA